MTVLTFSLYDSAVPRWHREAVCRFESSTPFFTEPDSPGTASDAEWLRATLEAKSICLGCPVRSQCLAWSLSVTDDLDGVFGGANKRDRQNAQAHRNPEWWLSREFGRQSRRTRGFATIRVREEQMA